MMVCWSRGKIFPWQLVTNRWIRIQFNQNRSEQNLKPRRSVKLLMKLLKSFCVGYLGSFPQLQQTSRIMVQARVAAA